MKVSLGPYPKSSKKHRKIKVQIDKYDTWSLDHTLAWIIHPALIQLRDTSHGSPMVDLEDLPESLQLTEHHDYDPQLTFKFYDAKPEHEIIHIQWRWVLGEMIWAFNQIKHDGNDDQFYKHPKNTKGMSVEEQVKLTKVDEEGLKKHHDRISNGLRLFGKYYRHLWD